MFITENVKVGLIVCSYFRMAKVPSAVENSVDIYGKFYGDRPRGTHPSGELNTEVVAKYADFGPRKLQSIYA